MTVRKENTRGFEVTEEDAEDREKEEEAMR